MNKLIYITVITALCLIDTGLFWFIATSFQSSNPAEAVLAMVPVKRTRLPKKEMQTLKFRFVGDVMLGRAVNMEMNKRNDWNWPFRKTMPLLPPADMVVGNLETPLLSSCPFRSDGMIFCASDKAVEGLLFAGFNVMSLANNHSFNYGSRGYEETKTILDKASITYLEHGKMKVIEQNGLQVGLIAYDDLTYPITQDKMSLNEAEAVIAFMHWGNEYQVGTTSARQRMVASWLHEAGADVVIGSHPHVVQPIEQDGTRVTAYSLGNFVFDQMWSESTRKGLVVDVTLGFADKKLKTVEYVTTPIKIYEYGQPRIE